MNTTPSRSPRHSWRRSVWLALLVLPGATALGEALPGWRTNLTAAVEEAAELDRPVLLYFTAAWCGPCQAMARTTLRVEAVTNAIAALIPVAVDVDENSELARTRGVNAVPTFGLLSPAGEPVVRTTGFQSPEAFVHWITNGVAAVRTAAAHQRQLESMLADARRARHADPTSADQAATWLFDLCAEPESAVQQAALAELAQWAEQDPAALLAGLNHPRLATRIHVANLLSPRLGDTFAIDPWAEADTRRDAIAQWRLKLDGAQLQGME
jgi:thioredoxin-like negative regulator of GroEL